MRVEVIDMCEIDEQVVAVAKEHFSDSTATSFDDPRLTLVHADAAAYLKAIVDGQGDSSDPAIAAALKRRSSQWPGYDVIIVDSSDPVGPAETLFAPAFYDSMKAALAPNGIVCTQGECLWLHLPLIAKVVTACRATFPSVEYAYTTVPTYPSGQIGFVLCSLDDGRKGTHPADARADVTTPKAIEVLQPRRPRGVLHPAGVRGARAAEVAVMGAAGSNFCAAICGGHLPPWGCVTA